MHENYHSEYTVKHSIEYLIRVSQKLLCVGFLDSALDRVVGFKSEWINTDATRIFCSFFPSHSFDILCTTLREVSAMEMGSLWVACGSYNVSQCLSVSTMCDYDATKFCTVSCFDFPKVISLNVQAFGISRTWHTGIYTGFRTERRTSQCDIFYLIIYRTSQLQSIAHCREIARMMDNIVQIIVGRSAKISCSVQTRSGLLKKIIKK